MKTLKLLGGFMVLVCGVVAAQNPPDPKKSEAVPLVLLLKSFQIVEGVFERDAEGHYVQRIGRESRRFTEADVLVVGSSRDEVRRYLLTQAQVPSQTVPRVQGFNSQATRTFAGKLQPLLMNACVNCHGKPDHASRFKLARVPEGYADPAATRRNLEVTLKFVTADDPSNSALVLKAIQPHGGQRQPAFRDRQILAVQNLEKWLHWACLPEGADMPEMVPSVSAKPSLANEPPRLGRDSSPTPPTAGKVPTSTAVLIRSSADPFDPAIFNQFIPLAERK